MLIWFDIETSTYNYTGEHTQREITLKCIITLKSHATLCVTQQSYKHFMQEQFKDTKEVIRSRKSKNDK